MCMSAPKVPQVQPAPPPAPTAAPIEEDKAPMVETAVDVDKDEVATKKKKKVGTSALQTSSGLNIPTVSGLNIT